MIYPKDAKYTEAFVTLVTSDDYVIPAIYLIQSLIQTKTKRKIICMYNNIKEHNIELLEKNGCIPILVEEIPSPYKGTNQRWKTTFSKLNVWKLNYSKVIFLDADCLVFENVDELFELKQLSAVLDPNTDYFNSGVMVIEPSISIFQDMIKKIGILPSYDESDQGFLNSYFEKNFYPLKFEYNADQYVLSLMFINQKIKIIHYSHELKPWKDNVIPINERHKMIHDKWKIFLKR